jgi:hypothetical protein
VVVGDEPGFFTRLKDPLQRLGGGVHLILVLGLGEAENFLPIVLQPRSLLRKVNIPLLEGSRLSGDIRN